MSEHTTQETLMYLRQCLLPGTVQDGIDLEVPSWLVREAAEALAALEQRVEGLGALCKEVENVLGMAHSFANFPSWLEQLEKALASQEEADLDKLTTQQKPTEEAMEEA